MSPVTSSRACGTDERGNSKRDGKAALEWRSAAWDILTPSGATPDQFKKLTLTNLYDARPTWLARVHAALDRTVWASYGWADPDPATVPVETILARLLSLNGERAEDRISL